MDRQELLAWIAERADAFDRMPNPFATTTWMRLFLTHVARDDWRFEADEASLLIGYSTPSEPHVLRALRNYYTCLLCARGALERPFERPVVDLAPLERTVAEEIASGLRGAGWYVRTYFSSSNHYLPCAGLSADEYLGGRSSQLQNTLKRKGKKFPGRLEIVTGGERLEAGIAAYQSVYGHSWKQAEPYPQFVPEFIRACADRGWLRLALAWVDEVPVAAQFWFVYAGTAFVYKLAYHEQYKALSAGSLLTAALMRHVLDVDRVSEVDYLSGDDAYKREWMTAQRPRVGLLCCNLRSARGIRRAAYEYVGAVTQRLRSPRAA